ncbi:MAG: hypothetical protein Q4P14_04760 [Methanobacteriaceae archaeon]|nr:hypothetical protein [Methanobacteriaceae archaeon]
MGVKVKIIAIIALVVILVALMANVLFLAADTSEDPIAPGVDMAALWNLKDGFQWIYPGSSINAQGHTLHNIYLDSAQPYPYAKDIIEYTYHTSPNVCVVIDDHAAKDIFGDDLIDNIREKDWGEGYDRGDAITMSIAGCNVFQIIPNIITGHIKIYLI